MNPISHLNPLEQNLCNKADLNKVPIAGNIELLPLCNMDCKMCFAKMNVEQMNQHHRMYDYKEWLAKAKEMSDAGTIFLLLTGGEPFLYPNFKELYQGLKRLGFIISINTNGTLINEEIADYLAKDPPRRLNITLYGSNNDTYEKLCGNKYGFSQVMNAVRLLKERDIEIKFNCSLTPLNIHEQEEIFHIAESLDIPIEMGFYMFPPVRLNNIENVKYRLDPIEAARARFKYEQLLYKEHYIDHVFYSIQSYESVKDVEPYRNGYTCRSGNSVYWVNYDGTLSACSFTVDKKIDLFKTTFKEAWNDLLNHVSSSKMAKECFDCKKRILCGKCAATAISETGDIGKVPQYYCDLTDEYIRLLYDYKENDHEN